MSLLYWPLTFFTWFTHRLKRLAIHMVRWTGKSDVAVHPKHLIGDNDQGHWYLKFLAKSDDVLDVGCGNGGHTFRVAPRVRRVAGIDYSDRNLRDANEILAQKGFSNVEFVKGDLSNELPFAEGRFDKVLFLDVLEHLHSRVPVLQRIRRVMKPEGVLLVSVPNCETSWRKLLTRSGAFAYSDADHKIEYTREGLIEELREGGFEPADWYPSVYDTPWIGFIDVVGGISLKMYKRIQDWRHAKAAARPHESIGFWVICRPK
jgi:SAM-dependent methyltransferase